MTGRFTEGLSWLHARVGRRHAARGSRAGDQRTNARVRGVPSNALQPTVYSPSGSHMSR